MSFHKKDWLKLLGGAALLATGAGAAGIGPLAGLLGGTGAGAGAGAAAGTAAADAAAATAATTLAGEGALATGAGMGAGVLTPAAAEASAALLPKAGLDLSALLASGAKGAAGSAGAAGMAQAMAPEMETTRTGQLAFNAPPPLTLPQGSGMTYEQQLRQLGFI